MTVSLCPLWVGFCRSKPPNVLVKSNANDWSSRMQRDGQVCAITHVETLEILGADNLAHVRIVEAKLVVRLPYSERARAGSKLWIHFGLESLHFVDTDNGQHMEPNLPEAQLEVIRQKSAK